MSDNDSILVLNAGSSSLKFSVFQVKEAGTFSLPARGQIDGLGMRPRLRVKDAAGAVLADHAYDKAQARLVQDAIALTSVWLRDKCPVNLIAVGHRVVHGGAGFAEPVVISEAVYAALEQLVPLAPPHQPHNLAAIRAVFEAHPDVTQIACFDTAFHRSHSQFIDLYALPWEYYAAGIRSYGFHGLSCEFIAATLPQVAPDIDHFVRKVSKHIGALAAVLGGLMRLCSRRASVRTRLGFAVASWTPAPGSGWHPTRAPISAEDPAFRRRKVPFLPG